jgi:multiple sugar transport system permease protein
MLESAIWRRCITWLLLRPVTVVVALFSVIQTFADFQIVHVMTGGGPHLFVSLAMFPILFLVVIIQLLYIRRVEVR